MYEQIARNKRKSVALFAGFLLLYGAIGAALYWYAGPGAAIIVAAITVGISATALFGGDDMAVRVAGGVRVERKEDAPELWRLVENLSIVAGIPMPRIYISPDRSANAFAAGRTPDKAIVCVHQGLLDLLDDRELEGVLAHELSHVRNYDVRLMTYASVLAGSIVLLAQIGARVGLLSGGRGNRSSGGGAAGIIGLVIFLATIILAPLGAAIIQLSISRKREFVADASAAELTRYPQALASALQRISGDDAAPAHDERSIAHMMIAPQLTKGGKTSKLFSTHPPTQDRVDALMEMASGVPHLHGAPVSQTFLERSGATPHISEPATPSTPAPSPPSVGPPGA